MSIASIDTAAPAFTAGDIAPDAVVVLWLPPGTATKMFRPRDLQRLRSAMTVLGPFADMESPDAISALAKATVIITGWGTHPLNKAFFTQTPRLQLLAHSAGSIKHMVDPVVFERGVRLVTAAAMNAVPVAEFTVAMMVTLLKQTPWMAAAYARGDRDEIKHRLDAVRELAEMPVGIIGASRIGRLVIRLLAGYRDLTIKVADPYLSADDAAALGVQRVSLEDACRCDVVSVHAPNLPETKHILNADRLALLPDHAVLINTARGALLDESALIAEMKRRPLYVALDVTDPEPPAPNSPLRTLPNVLLTPHIAGAMNQGRFEMGELTIDETLRFLRDQPLQYEVTQAMLATQA